MISLSPSLITTVISCLRLDDLPGAARHFALALQLPQYTAMLPASEGADDVVALAREHLLPPMESPAPDDVRWWRAVAEGWLQAGIPHLTLASACQARRLVAQRAPTTWQELSEWADLAARAAEQARLTTRRQGGLPAGVPPDSAGQKRSRLLAVLGRGAAKDRVDRMSAARDALDLPTFLVCSTAEPGDINRFAVVEMWHRCGEARAAVEEFLVAIADSSLADWLRRGPGGIVACGQALSNLGDQVTAYACFLLTLRGQLSQQPDPQATEEQPERRFATHEEVARDYCHYLRWAEDLLLSRDGCFHPFTTGMRAGHWMNEVGLPGHFAAYLRSVGAPGKVDAPAAISRQVRNLEGRWGWTPLDPFEGCRPAATPPLERPCRLEPLVPPPFVPWQRATSPDAAATVTECRSSTAPSGGGQPIDLHAFLPPPLDTHSRSASAGRGRVSIGFTQGHPPVEAYLNVIPNTPVLLLGSRSGHPRCPLVTDELLSSLARQLRANGWTVLWVRKGDSKPVAFEPGDEAADWLRITQSQAPPAQTQQWAADLAKCKPMRDALIDSVWSSYPFLAEKSLRRCLDSVISHAADGPWWDALAARDGAKLGDRVVAEVSSYLGLMRWSTADLRHAAWLVRHLTQAVDLLSHALHATWSGPEGRCSGVLVDAPGDDPFRAALLTVLSVGSFTSTADACASVPENIEALLREFEEFDMQVRKREAPGTAREKPSEMRVGVQNDREALSALSKWDPEYHDPSPAQSMAQRDRLLRSAWVQARALQVPQKRPVCVLVSGAWGPEWNAMVDWFQPGGIAQHCALVVASQDAAPDFLCRELLQGFRTFVVGELQQEYRDRFKIATGICLPPAGSGPPHSSCEGVICRVHRNSLEREAAVIWADAPVTGS